MGDAVSAPQFTPADHEAAAKETARLQSELDITNADHIALWIEANTSPYESMNQCTSWLACRIVDAHEAARPNDALIAELAEVLEEGRLIVANLPHDESLFLAKIDAALAKAVQQ